MSPREKGLAAACLVTVLAAACGSSSGSRASDGGPNLSAAQASYESAALASNGGLHDPFWSFHPAPSTPSSASGDFIVDVTSGGLETSPAGGAQTETEAWDPLSASLSVPALPVNIDAPAGSPTAASTAGPTVRLPSMVVRGGGVVVVSANPTLVKVSYVGEDIEIDTLASDGKTVAFGTTITAVNPISVTGQLIAAPTDRTLAGWLNKDYLVANGGLLKSGAAFEPGSEYLLFTATRTTDTLFVGDCGFTETSTTPATLVACQTNATIGGAGRLSETAFSDGTGNATRVWTFATDGSTCEIASQGTSSCPSFGVRYWVATAPRTSSMNVPAETTAYRVYYELGGNIYSGELVRAGTPLGENLGSDAKPNVIGGYLRVNSAFVASLKSALTF